MKVLSSPAKLTFSVREEKWEGWKRENSGRYWLSAFRSPLSAVSFRFRKSLLSSSRQGQPLPKGCPPSLATNNLTSGSGRSPHVTGTAKNKRLPPSDEGVPQAVDFFGPYLAREALSRSTVTRRHEAGCRGVGARKGGLGDSGFGTGH